MKRPDSSNDDKPRDNLPRVELRTRCRERANREPFVRRIGERDNLSLGVELFVPDVPFELVTVGRIELSPFALRDGALDTNAGLIDGSDRLRQIGRLAQRGLENKLVDFFVPADRRRDVAQYFRGT